MPPDKRDKQDELTRLLDEIRASSKYADVSADLTRAVAIQELQKRRSAKEVLKAIKSKLHQVGGAYLAERASSGTWLAALQQAVQMGGQEGLRTVCREIMQNHASTRERLPILDAFYPAIFAELPPVHSVLDIACGLNPLAIPWMELPEHVEYYAYDIYQHLTDFLQAAFPLFRVKGEAQVRDVVGHCPEQSADVAFVLKTLPCLEQIDKGVSKRLLQALNVRHLVVSFPVASLGGRSKGMVGYYEMHFRELLTDLPWKVKKVTFATELVFVVTKE